MLREATAASSTSGTSRSAVAKALAILPVPRMPQRIILSIQSSFSSGLPLRAEYRVVCVKSVILLRPPAGNAQHRQGRETALAQAFAGQARGLFAVQPCAAGRVVQSPVIIAGQHHAGVGSDRLVGR